MHATRSANFNILDFIARVLFYEEYTLRQHSKQLTIGKDTILRCPRQSAASRIRRRQEAASAPRCSTAANNGREHRLPVQRSVYKRTF